jgi:methylenetetrahydrofolate reductase (NADPH)
MRFGDIFAKAVRPLLSFELFPPKTDQGMDGLRQVIPELVALRPAFMTVTYGAGGSTRERTLEIAAMLRREYGVETACHLTCVGSSRVEIDRILAAIRAADIDNLVALRGDPPKGEATFQPAADGYAHASELVQHVRRSRHAREFGIAVAGYPEKHIEAPDLATDIAHLKHKVDAGADLVITQLFYDNADFLHFEVLARQAGVAKPIVPGLLPVLSVNQIRRITALCGAKIPPGLHEQLEEAGDDDVRAEEAGVRYCVGQAEDLLRRGVPGIHFYVLNKASHVRRIVTALRTLLG